LRPEKRLKTVNAKLLSNGVKPRWHFAFEASLLPFSAFAWATTKGLSKIAYKPIKNVSF